MTTAAGRSPGLASLLFGLEAPIGRRTYVVAGFSLLLLKYGVDAAVMWLVTGKLWHPLKYLSPILTLREQGLPDQPTWLFVALAIWTLPFAWIGVSMSVRRAVDAGSSPWLGLAFFVPILNYLVMLVFCVLPSQRKDGAPPPSLAPYRAPPPREVQQGVSGAVKSALYGILAGQAIAAVMALLSIYALALYGAALFFGTPLVMGAASAFLYNRTYPRTIGSTLLVGLATVGMAACLLLLFALEGLVCILMASPIVCALAVLGSLVGRAVALSSRSSLVHGAFVILALPVLAGFESKVASSPTYEVVTTIEIDAPPEVVWNHVVGFAELPPPHELEFRLGIAYPIRARIVGEGVGAVRRCEFSTGAFVEPITVWDPPRRLSFDVTAQPHPMHEWSPYRKITPPPHLESTIRSKRGELRLVELPGGRTRLEGSTWYELDMQPQSYWTIWSDALIHSVHERVLAHIKRSSEDAVSRRAGP